MKLKIYFETRDIEIDIQDYTEELLLEAMEGNTLALTKQDGNAIIINIMNVSMIEICK